MTLNLPPKLSWCRFLLVTGLLLAGAGAPWATALHAQTFPADTAAPVISLWSNPQLSFGTIGIPQPVINIVGHASAAHSVSSLQYSLNGDTAVSLSLGPDLRRLAREGDFNIDIKADVLKKWPARNNVTIRARDTLGHVTTLDVEITNRAPRRWPLPYEVSWSSPASLGDSAQVIDGKWSWTSRGIMPAETGYDRLVGIGDTAWRDYEVTADVAVLSIDSSDRVYDQINGGPGIGLLMRWNGHSNTPVFSPPITQPLSGYLPLGAIGWYHWRRGAPDTWELMGNNLRTLGRDTTQQLEFAVTYRFKMRVVTLADSGIRYSFKKWKKSEVEPEQWLLTGFQTLDNPQHGSFCLIAHHVTAVFGKVSVTPLGQDIAVTDVRTIVGQNSAYVTWKTSGKGSGRLLYGKSLSSPDTSRMDTSFSQTHEALLPDLSASTTYRFRIEGAAADGGATIEPVNGSFTTRASSPGPVFRSDGFDSTVVDSARWVFINTNPPSTLSFVEENSIQALAIEVPPVPAPDSWNGRIAPRIMQPAADKDLQAQVKFLSVPTSHPHIEGIMVEEDFDRFLRFDLMGDSAGVSVMARSFEGGVSRVLASARTTAGIPLYLQITRKGNSWRSSYSHDSTKWTTASSFNMTMRINGIGLFIGNSTEEDSTAPAFTGIVDHFLNLAELTTDASEPAESGVPVRFLLEQNYPNPFNPKTAVSSQVPVVSDVKIVVYDLLGREVAVLVNERREPGRYQDVFDASKLASGIYVYRLTAGPFSATRKMLLVR